MKWQEIDKHWQQFERMVNYQWQKLTKIDLEQINGNKAMLNVKLQGHYKQNQEEANKSIDDFLRTFQGILQGAQALPVIQIGNRVLIKQANKPVSDLVVKTL